MYAAAARQRSAERRCACCVTDRGTDDGTHRGGGIAPRPLADLVTEDRTHDGAEHVLPATAVQRAVAIATAFVTRFVPAFALRRADANRVISG